MTYFLIRLSLCALLLTPASAQKESRRPITIRAVEGLQFDPPRTKIDPGQTVRFRILNRDPSDLSHNLLLLKPGTLAEIQKTSMKINQALIDRSYVPDHNAVIKATKLLHSDEGDDFLFTAPKEPGIYPYVCTFPGHAQLMYGALYVGIDWGSIERDKNVPALARERAKKAKEPLPIIRPYIKRYFLEKTGPAAIAVALENDLNYCWDAGNCRLRYAWSGDFIDLTKNSHSNGNRQFKPLGKVFWNGEGGESTYTVQTGNSEIKPDFKGYRLVKGIPEFTYQFGSLTITEFITSTSEALINTIKISNAKESVTIYAKGKITSNVGTREGDCFIVPAKDATNIILTISAK
ncbi:MAG: plastocyanin/azurin family copper-binding protein [Akkermansiaceae bacterium]